MRRCALQLYEMTPDKAPFEGTVMANPLPSVAEIRCRVAQVVGDARVVWPPAELLPMLPNDDTKAIVSSLSSFLLDSFGFPLIS